MRSIDDDPHFDLPDIDLPEEPEDDTQPDGRWQGTEEYWKRIARRLGAMAAEAMARDPQLPLPLHVTRVRQYPPARDFDLRSVWENL